MSFLKRYRVSIAVIAVAWIGMICIVQSSQDIATPPPPATSGKRIAFTCPGASETYLKEGPGGLSEGCVKSGNTGPILHGPQIRYWPNGQPKSVETYSDGKREGEGIGYFEDGKISRIENARNGLLEGRSTYFDSDGSKYYEAIFSSGNPTKELFRKE